MTLKTHVYSGLNAQIVLDPHGDFVPLVRDNLRAGRLAVDEEYVSFEAVWTSDAFSEVEVVNDHLGDSGKPCSGCDDERRQTHRRGASRPRPEGHRWILYARISGVVHTYLMYGEGHGEREEGAPSDSWSLGL